MKTIWFLIKPYKFRLALLVGLALLIGVIGTLSTAILYPIITVGLDIQATQSNFIFNLLGNLIKIIPISDLFVAYCILFIALVVLSALLGIVYTRYTLETISKIVVQNKQRVFRKYSKSDYQLFIDIKQGELIYTSSKAPLAIPKLLNAVTGLLEGIALALPVLVLLLSISLPGTLLTIVIVSGFYFLNRYLSINVSYFAGRNKYAAGQIESVTLNEYITGIKLIKVFETYAFWTARFDKAIKRYWNMYTRSEFWKEIPAIGLQLVLFSLIGVVIIITKLRNPTNFISLFPTFGIFAFAALKLLPNIASAGKNWMQIMNALPDIEAIHNTLTETAYSHIKNGAIKFATLNSGIEFCNVSFAYKNRGIVLDNISLQIKKGAVAAIVGQSGSGKSTICDLLLRLYDVNEGQIRIDGIDIREYDLSSLLRKIGYVSQETFIYNASVRENIFFGNRYSEPDLIEAAKLADADEFIEELPQKYDTLLGDRGVRLSGGQRQRIVIARAMIRKPEILILDEATSSLDNISERIVQHAIDKVSRNCTTLIIAHRLTTIQNADIIYVLKEGRIVEGSTSEQLVKQKGEYWKLYNLQSVK
jgi:ATP-binding cassette, subfamily B, bacterial